MPQCHLPCQTLIKGKSIIKYDGDWALGVTWTGLKNLFCLLRKVKNQLKNAQLHK